MITEIWKTIEDFEKYKISNFGNVKNINFRNTGKERLLKPFPNKKSYLLVKLYKDGIPICRTVHSLVAVAFISHKPCGMELVINHKDYNKQNNNVLNLEIITNRENCNKKHLKSSSKYTGVCWDKQMKKWRAKAMINGKQKFLGLFKCEIEASKSYKNAINNI